MLKLNLVGFSGRAPTTLERALRRMRDPSTSRWPRCGCARAWSRNGSRSAWPTCSTTSKEPSRQGLRVCDRRSEFESRRPLVSPESSRVSD